MSAGYYADEPEDYTAPGPDEPDVVLRVAPGDVLVGAADVEAANAHRSRV